MSAKSEPHWIDAAKGPQRSRPYAKQQPPFENDELF